MVDDSEKISNISKIQSYLVSKDIVRPKLFIDITVTNPDIKTYTFTRKLSFFRKQILVFNTYTDTEKYTNEFVKYCTNFVQFFNAFIDKEVACGNSSYIKNIIVQYNTLSLYSIPELMYYIESLFSQNGQFYSRFKSAIMYLEHIHSKKLIDSIKINADAWVIAREDFWLAPKEIVNIPEKIATQPKARQQTFISKLFSKRQDVR